MDRILTPEDLALLQQTADRVAAALVRKLGRPQDDVKEFSQELIVDFLERFEAFDPARSPLGAFAHMVMHHQAIRIKSRIARERELFCDTSLDQEMPNRPGEGLGDSIPESESWKAMMGGLCDGFEAIEVTEDLDRGLGVLQPRHIDLCRELVDRTPTEIARAGSFSRATIHRHTGEMKLCFIMAGVKIAA